VTVQAPTTSAVIGIACVYLPVSDVYASTQWYVRNLGLEVAPNTPLVPEMGHAILIYPSRGPSVFLLGSDRFEPAASHAISMAVVKRVSLPLDFSRKVGSVWTIVTFFGILEVCGPSSTGCGPTACRNRR
jgi:hypothetical protein